MRPSRIAAFAAALTMIASCAACGDEENTSRRKKSSSEAVSEAEEETKQPAVNVVTAPIEPASEEEAGTEPTTEAPATEPPTEAPKTPKKVDAYYPDVVGSKVCEVVELLGGDFRLETDYQPGTYIFSNEEAAPGVKFYFTDESYNDVLAKYDLDKEQPEELKSLIARSSATVEKINLYSGSLDDFSVGEKYTECERTLGKFPLAGGNMGEYLCGAPASLCYSYPTRRGNAIAELHFELPGDIDRKLNEGYYAQQGSSDVPSADAEKADPKIEVLTLETLAPQKRPSSAKASSTLPDIKEGNKTHTYVPANVLDGDNTTCWCENAKDDGVGEYIEFDFSSSEYVQYVTVWGGLLTSKELFEKNGRPKRVRVETDGDYPRVYHYDLPTSYVPDYPRCLYVGKDVKKIKITIEAVETGAKYQDTAISKVVFN